MQLGHDALNDGRNSDSLVFFSEAKTADPESAEAATSMFFAEIMMADYAGALHEAQSLTDMSVRQGWTDDAIPPEMDHWPNSKVFYAFSDLTHGQGSYRWRELRGCFMALMESPRRGQDCFEIVL